LTSHSRKGRNGTSDSDKRKLAKHVAALANTSGGLIILGIEEDNQGQATAAPGVPISDSEIASMHQLVGGTLGQWMVPGTSA
jgi:predicted HTH transcriptional regulator